MQVTLDQFLTAQEIKQAFRMLLRSKLNDSERIKYLVDKITGPNIDRINKALGQENDPQYLAYAIIYCFNLLHKGK